MIKLICFIESINNELLKHFISHYNNIGVEIYHFICFEKNNPIYFQNNIHYHEISLDQFCNEQKKQTHQRRSCHYIFENNIKEQHINKNDWCFIVDLDEFVDIYYNELLTIINSHTNVVEGYLIDRITNDGKIPNLVRDIDIDQQFPKKIRLTKYANRCEKKIFLTKGCIKHGCGHHCLLDYNDSKFYSQTYQIFHYKWFAQNLVHLHKTYPFNNLFANTELEYIKNNQFSSTIINDIDMKYSPHYRDYE